MINENTSLMQLLSIYFSLKIGLYMFRGETSPIIRR